MPSCSFNKCTNHSAREKKSHGITFHAFPKDELWRLKWQCVVREQRQELDWVATSNSRVCSVHFNPEDIYTTTKGLKRIKNEAVPCFQTTRSTKTPDHNTSELERNLPHSSFHDTNISDLDSNLETPRETYLKRKVRKINIRRKILFMENKSLRRKNKRLKIKYELLKQTMTKLKKKFNISEDQFQEFS